MECFCGLLREDCFSRMRNGLRDLRAGTLDRRDMLVLNGFRVLAMSPPAARGGAEGTVLELAHTKRRDGALPMFGSLLALSHRADFADAIWATVAGADNGGKGGPGLHLFIELTPRLNEEDSDASLLAKLLRHSGDICMAQSPTFYRAYGAAEI